MRMVKKTKKKARKKTLEDINLLAQAIVKASTEETDKQKQAPKKSK